MQTCSRNEDCESGWCCDKEVGGTGQCRSSGDVYNSKWLCDPPWWRNEDAGEKVEERKENNEVVPEPLEIAKIILRATLGITI